LALLITVAVIGIFAAMAVSMGTAMSRRSAEQEMYAVGEEFAAALSSYRLATMNGTMVNGPASLEDLLEDKRFAPARRHLRKLYADPLTGQVDWRPIRGIDGEILAVQSMAEGVPVSRPPSMAMDPEAQPLGRYEVLCFGIDPAKLQVKEYRRVMEEAKCILDLSQSAPNSRER